MPVRRLPLRHPGRAADGLSRGHQVGLPEAGSAAAPRHQHRGGCAACASLPHQPHTQLSHPPLQHTGRWLAADVPVCSGVACAAQRYGAFQNRQGRLRGAVRPTAAGGVQQATAAGGVLPQSHTGTLAFWRSVRALGSAACRQLCVQPVLCPWLQGPSPSLLQGPSPSLPPSGNDLCRVLTTPACHTLLRCGRPKPATPAAAAAPAHPAGVSKMLCTIMLKT